MSAGQDRAQDPARAALERRYLRLLRCYPPSHRQAHREEMLGVLLAAARPGQPGGLLAGFLARTPRGLAIAGWRRACLILAGLAGPSTLRSTVASTKPGSSSPFGRQE